MRDGRTGTSHPLLTRDQDPEPLHDWELERGRLGELPPHRQALFETQCELDPTLRRRLERLDAADAALLQRLSPQRVAAEVHRKAACEARVGELTLHSTPAVRRPPTDEGSARHRPESPSSIPRWRDWLPTGGGMVLSGLAAAVLALLVLRPDGRLELVSALDRAAPPGTPAVALEAGDGSVDPVREKGLSPRLSIFKLQEADVAQLREGEAVPPHTVVQVSYLAAGYAYGAILSVDGAGIVTLHQPTDARLEPRMDPSGEHRLAHAYELDDAPGFERFVLVFSRAPFKTEAVLAAARQVASSTRTAEVAPLSLPEGVHQTSFLLRKVTP